MNIHILVFSWWYLCCSCLWQQGISRICIVFLWIITRQTFFGRYIISLFDYNRPTWIQAVIAEQVFLKKNLNFNMQVETIILTLPHKTSFWYFCQNATLPGNVNKEVCPNMWKRNIFWASSLHALGVHRYISKTKVV